MPTVSRRFFRVLLLAGLVGVRPGLLPVERACEQEQAPLRKTTLPAMVQLGPLTAPFFRHVSLPPQPLPHAANRLGVRSRHVFGLCTAVPAVLLGLMGATQRGWYRYLGFTDNGNPALYPGYVETNAPYFLRHNVSDRHFPVARDSHVHGIAEKKARA